MLRLVFKIKAATALAISVIADTLDYVAGPLFALPIVGDILDAIVTSILYTITKNKRSTLVNLIEFVPILGDFVPTYTLTTLWWLYNLIKKERNQEISRSL